MHPKHINKLSSQENIIFLMEYNKKLKTFYKKIGIKVQIMEIS